MATHKYYSKVDVYRKQKKKRFPTFRLLLFIAILVGGYFAWDRYQEGIRYFFLPDRYKKISEELQKVSVLIENSQEPSIVSAFVNKVDQIAMDFPNDGYIFLTRGLLYTKLSFHSNQQNMNIYQDLFFEDYLNHYKFPRQINRKQWYVAIVSLRKALHLELNRQEKLLAKKTLASLYLFGGRSYAQAGIHICKEEQQENICQDFVDFYRLLLPDGNSPNWLVLQQKFGSAHMLFWQAIYLLKQGSQPQAFTLLSQIVKEQKDIVLKNNAMYLMSFVLGKQKKYRDQVHYQNQIELAEFVPRQKWFEAEYLYNLRFLGLRAKAEQIEKTIKTFSKKK